MGKTHDFTKITWGEEFVIDAPLSDIRGSLTGQGSLDTGDHIILCIRCRVDEVEYYINAPDIWQASVSFEKPVSLDALAEGNPLQTIKALISQLGDSLNQGDFYQRLEQVFTIDRLTQVANRGRFESRLAEAWKQMRRSRAPISLIFGAFDGMTAYQEAYGVQATERCMQEIAKVFQSCVNRPSDLVARYQDYMFAVLLPDTPESGVQHVLEHLQSQLGTLPFLAPESKPPILPRLGVASLVPGFDQESQDLIQMAARSIA